MKAVPEGVTMGKKPTFQVGGAYWVNPEYLPPNLVEKLKEILSSRTKMTVDKVDDFLNRCHNESQFLNEILVVKSNADTKERLALLATKAADLLEAMKGLSVESVKKFSFQFDNFAFLPDQPVKLSYKSEESRFYKEGRFLGAAWDAITDLEAVAKHAATRINTDKGDQVASLNANRFIWNICDAYRVVTDKLPPYSKGTWFPEFMDELGQWKGLNLKCGRTRIETVIKKMGEQRDQVAPPD